MAIPAATVNHTLFFTLGIVLVASAVIVSVIGLRFEKFPPNRTVMFGVLAYFALLVGATGAFAVRNANDETEQAKNDTENAKVSSQISQSEGTTSVPATTTSSGTPSTPASSGGGGGGASINISADPTGQLKFEQTSVTAKAGNDTIDFTNMSPLGHNVQIQDASGKVLGGTKTITGTKTTATVALKPGKYTFFCSVPGHEQAGMKGTLTVK